MLDSLDTLIAFILILLVVSLLITILVQMISSALNLRGYNLAWGLGETLKTAAPDLTDTAHDIAGAILRGSLLSDSSKKSWWPPLWRLATAARPDEIFDAIHRVANDKTKDPGFTADQARQILLGLGVPQFTLDQARTGAEQLGASANGIIETTKALIATLPDSRGQEVLAAFNDFSNRVTNYESEIANKLTQGGGAMASAVDAAYQRFEYWFKTAQERGQQWFTMHTRFITVILAFVAAFALQLDTGEIFKLVSTSRDLRNKLVAQAGIIQQQAEKTLVDEKAFLQEVLENWKAELPPDAQGNEAIKKLHAETSDTRTTLYEKVKAALPSDIKEKQLSALNAALDNSAKAKLAEEIADYKVVKADLAKTSYELFPVNNWRWGSNWLDGSKDHILGMLVSAGLLSLGAPFWYNALKSLTSLRSVVADNISDEQKQNRKKIDQDNLGSTPPTVKPA